MVHHRSITASEQEQKGSMGSTCTGRSERGPFIQLSTTAKLGNQSSPCFPSQSSGLSRHFAPLPSYDFPVVCSSSHCHFLACQTLAHLIPALPFSFLPVGLQATQMTGLGRITSPHPGAKHLLFPHLSCTAITPTPNCC